jgi:hypothetical protein
VAIITVADRGQLCAMPEGLFVYAWFFTDANWSDRWPPDPDESGNDYQGECDRNSEYKFVAKAALLASSRLRPIAAD